MFYKYLQKCFEIKFGLEISSIFWMTIAIATAHVEIVVGREYNRIRMSATQRGAQQNRVDSEQSFLALLQRRGCRRAELGSARRRALYHGVLRVRQAHEFVQKAGSHV